MTFGHFCLKIQSVQNPMQDICVLMRVTTHIEIVVPLMVVGF